MKNLIGAYYAPYCLWQLSFTKKPKNPKLIWGFCLAIGRFISRPDTLLALILPCVAVARYSQTARSPP
ncbi:hypothetical protein [Moraxella lacunata]|uniref:hypothetical protein n=1 Tax=Moraxella lacunata TaxID=477 RepID=UPI003EE1A255